MREEGLALGLHVSLVLLSSHSPIASSCANHILAPKYLHGESAWTVCVIVMKGAVAVWTAESSGLVFSHFVTHSKQAMLPQSNSIGLSNKPQHIMVQRADEN